MKKNLYYRAVFQRKNVLMEFILSFFLAFSSYPRLLLEAFIRKDFGERYFKLSSALTVAVLLGVFPFIQTELATFFTPTRGDGMFMMRNQPMRNDSADLMPDYIGWFIYLAAFVILAFRHDRDIKRAPSVFDFARFSKYTGKVNPAFFRFHLPDRKTDTRRVECLFEPALFFVGGVLLHLIGQKLGGLLIMCSLFYGFSYLAAYVIGDNFVMDKIDEMICNQELEKSFVDDKDESDTRGFRFRGMKPNGRENRQKVLPLMGEQEEILQAK